MISVVYQEVLFICHSTGSTILSWLASTNYSGTSQLLFFVRHGEHVY